MASNSCCSRDSARSYSSWQPFNFLLAFQPARVPKRLVTAQEDDPAGPAKRRSSKRQGTAADLPHAIAPFDRDVAAAVQHCFDRKTGRLGKEANRWEEQLYLGENPEAQIEYGTAPQDQERAWGSLLRKWPTVHGAAPCPSIWTLRRGNNERTVSPQATEP
jgi:hypothetical protein